MSENNVYETPTSDVVPESTSTKPYAYTGPKSVSTGNSLAWIASGWGIFKLHPGQWIAAVIVFVLITMVLSFIPLVGQLANPLLTYIWFAGFMIGCQAVREGNSFSIDHLFAGFKNNVGSLLGLGAIMFLVTLVLMVAMFGSMFVDLLTGVSDQPNFDPSNIFTMIGISFLLFIPVLMALFYAPALIVLQDMGVFQSLKVSFQGCLKNLLPLIIFGIVIMLLYIIGMIPLLLGLLIVVPLFFASVYASYEDIFLTKQTATWVDEA
jgi:hypothetical protein